MALSINIGSKKPKTTTAAPKNKVDVSAATGSTKIQKTTTKAPTKKVSQVGASPTAAKKILTSYAPQIIEAKQDVDDAKKQTAKVDAVLKRFESDVVNDLIKEGVADEASVEVNHEGKIVTVGKAQESKTVTDNVEAYNMLEEIEEGLGQQLMKFSVTDLEKHLTSKQLESIITKKSDPKKRRVTVKDAKK